MSVFVLAARPESRTPAALAFVIAALVMASAAFQSVFT
jgi:hypothetical protein